MSEVVYRTPTEEDADRLVELARDTFIDTFGSLYSAEDLGAFLEKAFGESGLPRQISDPSFHLRVAEHEGDLIAFCKIGPFDLPHDTAGRRVIELYQLYVRKAWHGAGVAASLMDWAIERARDSDAQDIYLSVFSGNHRAQRFYARYGFEEVGQYGFVVGNHIDDERIWRAVLRG